MCPFRKGMQVTLIQEDVSPFCHTLVVRSAQLGLSCCEVICEPPSPFGTILLYTPIHLSRSFVVFQRLELSLQSHAKLLQAYDVRCDNPVQLSNCFRSYSSLIAFCSPRFEHHQYFEFKSGSFGGHSRPGCIIR